MIIEAKFGNNPLIIFLTTTAAEHTAKNTVVTPNFLVWKFCGKAQFLHSFYTSKLGEITVFFTVAAADS